MTAAAVAIALIAPWFVYAQVRFGNQLWETMFGAHVYTRFTTYLDPRTSSRGLSISSRCPTSS